MKASANSFATWSLRNPTPALLLFALLSIAGVLCFRWLPLRNMPDFQPPEFSIALNLPGASPTELETEVVIPVESSLGSLRGLESLESDISDSNVIIWLRFSSRRNVTKTLIDVKNALQQVQGQLPSGLEPPRIRELSSANGTPSVVYAVTSTTLDKAALSSFVVDTVEREVQQLPGVYRFELIGTVNREVEVNINPSRLTALGLTAADVSKALASIEEENSGGEAHIGGKFQAVRTVATAQTAADLAKLPVALPDGQHVTLGEIAQVTDSYAEPADGASYDGQPAVGFRVYDNPGSDELALISRVKDLVGSLEQRHPGIHFHVITSMTPDVLTEYHQGTHMLVEGALLAIIVILFFLGDLRATLIGAIALPLSILPTFIFLYCAGWTINATTLQALLIVTGILVDDAIVEIENIFRHMGPDVALRTATEQAVRDIGLAVTATTFALVVVFLPISFMSGFAGLIFRQFGWTASFAVITSLLVARLVTPILAIWILKKRHKARADSLLLSWYTKLVHWCIEHRAAVVTVTLLIVGASAYLYTTLPTGFIPPENEDFTKVSVDLPPGATVKDTMAVAAEVSDAILKPRPVTGVRHVFVRVGRSSHTENGGSGGPAYTRHALLTVAFAPLKNRPSEESIEEALRRRLKDIPGAQIVVNGVTFGSQVDVTLVGADPKVLLSTAKEVAREMHSIKGLTGISTNAGLSQTDIVIRPDFARAAALGITTNAIANTVRIATSGDYGVELAKLNLDTRQINVRVRLPEADEQSLQAISALRVRGSNGLVPLSAIARISFGSQPLQITRYDREQQADVTADLDGMPMGEAFDKISQLPAMRALPQGVQWVKIGEGRVMAQFFGQVGAHLLLAMVCVYALLVLLFKEPFQPITILCAAPLSILGALLGVWLSGSAIGLPVFLGFVMLLGIVTKNSILIVDFAQRAITERAVSAKEAIVEACRARARPIIMTTVAMVAGILPITIQIGNEDITFSRPIGATVIGGLITSTVLSLVVVPVVFVYIAQLKELLKRRRGPSESAPEHFAA